MEAGAGAQAGTEIKIDEPNNLCLKILKQIDL